MVPHTVTTLGITRGASRCPVEFRPAENDVRGERARRPSWAELLSINAARFETREDRTLLALEVLRDVNALPGDADPMLTPVAGIDSALYFAATGAVGRELWKTDGTETAADADIRTPASPYG
jgi:ELWxxDGT repeat protein